MHFRNIDSRHLTWIIILRTEDNMLPLCWQRWCSVTATPHYPPISIVGIFSLTKLKLQFVSVCLLQRVKENAQSRLTNGGFVWPRFCWFMFRLYKVFNGKISLLGDRLLIICNTCWLISWYGIFARRGHILIWGESGVRDQRGQSVHWSLPIMIYLPSQQSKQIIHHKWIC